jgi:rSAM/selenodomain-associated transferase 1
VTLWCAPDVTHRGFRDLGVALKPQPAGDLGARMLAAFEARPTLVIGTDCPALTAAHLNDAAAALETHDVVLIPAEDGGYVLIGARATHPSLFTDMRWSVPSVLSETRTRIAARGLTSFELPPLWDVDTEDDLARMERAFPELAL